MSRSTRMTLTLFVVSVEHEVEADVEYEYTAGRAARMWPWPGEPPEPAEVEVLGVNVGGVDVLPCLSPEQVGALCERLLDTAPDEIAGDDADRAYDNWRDRIDDERYERKLRGEE